MQYIKSAARGYLILLCVLGLLLLVLGGFRLLFEVTDLGQWTSHSGAFTVAGVAAIAAFYMSMTKYERVTLALAVIAGLSGFFALFAMLTGH